MNPKFFVDGYGALKVEMDGEQDVLVTSKFMQSENKAKAAKYLRSVAIKLTDLYQNDPGAAEALVDEAEDKVHQAQRAEKFLEPVGF